MALALMACCTAGPQTARAAEPLPPRPLAERAFPPAVELMANGRQWSCFERGGDAWRDVGHLVVDYRALLAWASWADGQIARDRLEVTNLEMQVAVLSATADDAQAALGDLRGAYQQEYQLRTAAEARAAERLPRWTVIGAGVIAGLEALALSAASIALAAR